MVGRPGKFQPRFTSGELDGRLQANTEVELYDKGAAVMQNVRPLPQGGFKIVDGLQKIDRVRGNFLYLPWAGGDPGAISAAVSGNTLVATLGVTGTNLCAIDVVAFGGSLAASPPPTWTQPNPPESPLVAGTITIKVFAGGVWTQLDNALGVVDTLRTRRFALPPGQTLNVSQVQVWVNATTPGGFNFYLQTLRAFSDDGTVVPAVIKPFTFNSAAAYDLVFTPSNVEVYLGFQRMASIPLFLTADQIRTFKWVQELATMFITHQAFQPVVLQRQGSDIEWNVTDGVFPYIPNYDFGDTVYTNFTPAQWEISFINFDTQLGTGTPPLPPGGVHYVLSVNGVGAAQIQQPPANYVGTDVAIRNALLTIPGVSPGVTVVQTQTSPNNTTYLITFGGAANQGDGWAVSGVAIDKADAAIVSAKAQVGVPGGEPIMSNARGWPGACGIYQQRLILAGFASVPLGVLWSETGNVYGFDTRLTGATAPFYMVLDGQGDETIVSVHLGRTLNFFTTYGEWWTQPGAISAVEPPVAVYSSSNGISPYADPVESEGYTTFVHASGSVILNYAFEWQIQNYASQPQSLSASSLVQNILDNALQRATGPTDINRHHLIRADGVAVTRATARYQDINAFTERWTDGTFIAVDVNARAEANFITARWVNGVRVKFLEKAVPGLWLDCAESVNVVAGQATISGLADYVGATVWAIVDGYVQGPFTVGAGASIALAFPALASGTAWVGRWTPPVVTTLPLPRDIGPRTVLRRPARAHTVRLNLYNSMNVAVGANGSGPYEVPLYRFGGLADTPASAQPYTGWAVCEGIPGFDDDCQVTITQTRPGALTVTGVTIEADL